MKSVTSCPVRIGSRELVAQAVKAQEAGFEGLWI